jgi:hypothetical protein
MAARETKAGADAMAYDGVLPETLVILVEVYPGLSKLQRTPRWVVGSSLLSRTPAAVGEERMHARTADATLLSAD